MIHLVEETFVVQQPRRVRHRRAALADLQRNFLLRQLKLFRQLRVAVRLFNRVEVLALQVLNEGQFEHGSVVSLSQDNGDFCKTEQLGRPPATFAGN